VTSIGIVSGLVVAGALGLIAPALAANETLGSVGQNNPNLNTTGSDVPLLQKMSDKGLYLVQIAWPQLPLNPDGAFDLQIFFLNATHPTGTNGTVVQPETNYTGSGSEGGAFTVPDTQQNFAGVKSYDITIYSDDGRVLWQKVDQPASGASPGQRIILGNYTGPVTIEIADIRPGSGTTTASEGSTDSVKFTASVTPEFPFALLGLAAAASVALVAIKFGGSLGSKRT
jgi:hypothetical protein